MKAQSIHTIILYAGVGWATSLTIWQEDNIVWKFNNTSCHAETHPIYVLWEKTICSISTSGAARALSTLTRSHLSFSPPWKCLLFKPLSRNRRVSPDRSSCSLHPKWLSSRWHVRMVLTHWWTWARQLSLNLSASRKRKWKVKVGICKNSSSTRSQEERQYSCSFQLAKTIRMLAMVFQKK